MSNGVYRAVSGSLAQLRQLDVLSNNLAHVDTPGYKGDRVRFREALDAAGEKTGYVDTPEAATSLTAGPMARTDNPLDLALNGDGFFVVDTPAGERLTRAGRFLVGGDGTLRTVSGHAVQGTAGPIQIPIVPEGDGSIDIRSDGQIFMNDRPLAKLKQVKATTDQIQKVDDQLFAVPDGVDQNTSKYLWDRYEDMNTAWDNLGREIKNSKIIVDTPNNFINKLSSEIENDVNEGIPTEFSTMRDMVQGLGKTKDQLATSDQRFKDEMIKQKSQYMKNGAFSVLAISLFIFAITKIKGI